MITLSKKLKQQQEGTNKEEIEHKRISIRDQLLIKGECGSVKDGCFTKLGTNKEGIEHKRISFRDQLLIKEVQEMEENLPKTCNVNFENPNVLHKFDLSIHPDEGYWHGGTFHFTVDVPDDYNIVPPKVHCDTRIWHPNIDEEGEVCLSLLRQNSYDMMGWAPTRRLKDVIWGLNSLFSDLLNFDDPLNVEAAEHYARDKESFKCKVQSYIELYATKR